MIIRKKDFDCVEMKRAAQEKIYDAIKQLTPEQEINYFRQAIEKSELSDWWKSLIPHTELMETQ